MAVNQLANLAIRPPAARQLCPLYIVYSLIQRQKKFLATSHSRKVPCPKAEKIFGSKSFSQGANKSFLIEALFRYFHKVPYPKAEKNFWLQVILAKCQQAIFNRSAFQVFSQSANKPFLIEALFRYSRKKARNNVNKVNNVNKGLFTRE